MKQVEVGKKLLIRYLKEQNIKVNKSEMVAALNERLNNNMSMLTSTIPYYVITTVIDLLECGDLNYTVKGFSNFYTDIMAQQE